MRIFEAGKTAVLAGLVASFVTLPGTAYALDENTVIQEQEKRSPWAVFRFAFSAYKRGDKEEALVAAVAQYGPVSICIDAEESFIKYKSGVYNGPCSSDVWKQNHCVSIVGYDVEEKYWLVRNTWGTGWGEDGYIRMAMGSNLCGITNEATIANVSKA